MIRHQAVFNRTLIKFILIEYKQMHHSGVMENTHKKVYYPVASYLIGSSN